MSEPCPPSVLEWIARYPDLLSDRERRAVERHVDDCSACLTELGMLRGLLEPPVRPANPHALFDRVLARIESERRGRLAAPGARPT